jgi:hypothetical protein
MTQRSSLATFILALATVALTATAQTPATIQILSDSSQVPVGRTLQLRAVVRDAGGNLIANPTVTWSSNNATNASVSNGVVTGHRLAVVRITARAGGVTAETAIQTIPSRVAITPDNATVNVGDTLQFAATAFDADDNPIPAVTWTWSIANLRQGTSQTARITTTGLMSAIAEGANFVFATFNYGDVQTGLQRQWITTARVETTVRTPYRLKRLFHNTMQMRTSFDLRARLSMLWSTDDGDLYFNASLDGLTGGLMNYRNGQFRLVSATGMPRFASGSFANEFFIHGIARNGKILSHEDTNINGRQLSLGDRNGLVPILSNNTPIIFGTEATSSIIATRHSLTSNGQMLIRANFRFENDPATYTGIFRGYNFRFLELLISSKDRLPELGSATAVPTIDADFGIADDGTAYYSATANGIRAFYRHRPAVLEREKLLATNDALLGSTIRTFNAGGGNQPNFWVDEASAMLILNVTLNDNSIHYISIDRNNNRQTLRATAQTGILGHHPAHGTLIHGNPFNNQGNGVYLWRPGATGGTAAELRSLFLYSRPSVAGTNFETIESGTINARGEVFIMGRTNTVNMGVARLGDNAEFLIYSGQTVNVEAPLNLVSLISGARTGPPHVLAGGTTGSIAEFDGRDFVPVLAIGERLFGNNTMYYGSFHGTTANVRKAPNGDLYAITGSGIARIVGRGAPELVLRFPLTQGSLTINNPGQIEVNSSGDILFQSSTNAGDNRLCIWYASSGNVAQIINMSATATTASTIDNRIAQSADNYQLTDDGRVVAALRFRNVTVPVLYLWQNQTWTRLAEPQVTQIGPHRITGIANINRHGSGRIFAALTIQAGGNIIAEWKGTEWEILVNNSTVMPNGQVTNSVANVDANRRGDVLFQQANAGNNFLQVFPGATTDARQVRQVINLFRPTPDGDYLVRLNAIDFRDDGTVYFLAMTADDETVLYEATPN